MAAKWYNKALTAMMKKQFDFSADTFKVMLVTSSYTFNVEDQYVSSANSAELSGTGYTGGFGGSGRKAITTPTVINDTTNHITTFDGDNIVESTINAGIAAAAIIIKEVTDDAHSLLIAYIDSGGFPITTNGGDLDINWNSLGILELQP